MQAAVTSKIHTAGKSKRDRTGPGADNRHERISTHRQSEQNEIRGKTLPHFALSLDTIRDKQRHNALKQACLFRPDPGSVIMERDFGTIN